MNETLGCNRGTKPRPVKQSPCKGMHLYSVNFLQTIQLVRVTGLEMLLKQFYTTIVQNLKMMRRMPNGAIALEL